ncbi:Vms1/Ankzf1 family peptidyl-tRNA hydrolase [Microbispora hainanensis]|uniref:Vms1/Ankzf1 family peptidyl-tRNA hydrolase n=1 Tax=Microbispora hainanensis TaxID=568844 RepID=A0ABZ1SQY8_9ACTN|nr:MULTISPECIES: Vms1/Ankzf1 family peptidyl-tRNA hydrolase [Microbispora]NJP27709.1 peptide chain release factor 1 [Microbispora sp. CL1-1]TQS10715.1 peptide chain release factor 1 [Microbispora sp. SCL1-1]
MRLDFIRGLYERSGPYASVYVDTDRSSEGTANVVQRRWAQLRERLAEEGAPASALDPIGELMSDPAWAAPGRAVFAVEGEVVFTEALRHRPRRQTARWSPLPHVVPLLAQRGEHVPHIEVLADRAGGDVAVVADGRRRELTVEVADPTRPLQKTGQGGWSQANFDREVEEGWRRNAVALAEVVEKEAHRIGAEVVVLAGDPKARGLVTDHLGKDVVRRLTVAEHGSRAPGADLDHFRREVEEACRAWIERRCEELLNTYASGNAVAGLAETARALRDRRVAVLLMHDDPSSTAMMWIGPEPTHLSTDPAELAAWGVEEPMRERADAALARAVAATDAELWFVPRLESPDGIGALLRF